MQGLHDQASQQELLNNWGVQLDTRLIEIDGRLLDASGINQGIAATTPQSGSGRVARREGSGGGGGPFVRDLSKQTSGLTRRNWRSGSASTVDFGYFCESKMYNDIKRVAEIELGLMTQCCVFKKIERANPAYCSNLSLKINSKLGGTNNVLVGDTLSEVKQFSTQTNQRVMIFDADVTHPGSGQRNDPNAVSIAAVTSSIDSEYWDYRAAVRHQIARQERIEDLEAMTTELMKHYIKRNSGQLPNRVIFYRDGVSEGQFEEILLHELPAIRKALANMTTNTPKITFFIMSKRHHVRFTPRNSGDADQKSGNVLAGTVVDSGDLIFALTRKRGVVLDIVHPNEFDFYLVSHPGLQGTSRPTHYHIIWDENEFTADELQKVTYHICYLFNHCSRSVSLVPAAYYAHLVAARARSHVGIIDDFSETGSGTIRDFGKVS
ncbi:hypothetical protein HK098_000897 [Nowakowskiella sp. JEL0407]|nr:hypothetical protein HK098_000897 [Nowakowskiella sp. JEL0407]